MPDKLLMIADADSLWTKRYIENLLLPAGYEVVLFPIWGGGAKFADFYAQNGVTVYHDAHTLPVVRHIPRARMWARVALNARDLARLGPFAVVHNHYLSQRDLALAKRLRRRFGARWACSFWGSDLMRAPARELARMRPYLQRCDAITVHNAGQLDRVRALYGEGARQRTTLLYFGQNGFPAIDRARKAMTRAQCKEFFGMDPRKPVVCLGYSASPYQRHLEALDALGASERLGGATLVLQMTYGGDAGYIRRVRERAEKLGCALCVLTDYLDDDRSARLRLAADVFVQSLATDAFSGSMQEYLYAGATVVKGAWLTYPQLRDMGIELREFADFAALPPLVDAALAGDIPPLDAEHRALFPRLYGWDAVRRDWLGLYR